MYTIKDNNLIVVFHSSNSWRTHIEYSKQKLERAVFSILRFYRTREECVVPPIIDFYKTKALPQLL